MTQNIYKEATKQGLRFAYKGIITTEDLWSLSVQELDKMYRALKKELNEGKEDSLLNTVTKKDEKLELQISIIKDVVETKLADKQAVKKQREVAAEKARLLELKRQKQEEKLSTMTEEEIDAQLAALDAE